jgi:hypothetical protein
MNGLRVLVCGGRNYHDQEHVWTTLSELNAKQPIGLLIHGAATGADRLAQAWALSRFIPDREFDANWPKHGGEAGAIRNQQVIDEGKPDLVVAFAGGPGTADLVHRAKLHGVKVIEVPPPRAAERPAGAHHPGVRS